MASISDLEDTIRACREMIRIIEEDIKGMEAGKAFMGNVKTSFNDQKESVDNYSLSTASEVDSEGNVVIATPKNGVASVENGDAWEGNLYDNACTKQDTISTELENAKTTCQTTIDELDTCISNAQDEIKKYEDQISDCEDEIERIQEEAAAAEAASGTSS